MPKVSMQSAANVVDHGSVLDRNEQIDGYTVAFTTFKADIDATPLLKGLPGDHCTCPHWGYVIEGRITYGVDGREEVVAAGEAFYVPPGHTMRAEAGTTYLQFSPTHELDVVAEQMLKNMQASQV